MNLNISNKLFVVCGATSGFGLSTLKALVNENAKVLAIARRQKRLDYLINEYPENVEILCGDITKNETIDKLIKKIGNRDLEGVLINSGGPPPMKFLESKASDWDTAYNQLLRWKVIITQRLIPLMQKNNYGRVIYIESSSVKQPIENLILSTSLRLAVVGFVKTLSQEIADSGITLNVLAPSYHETPAVVRLFEKKASVEGITPSEAKEMMIKGLQMQKIGNPDDLGKLAAWLFSPYSGYITGQTISVDGGNIKSIMG